VEGVIEKQPMIKTVLSLLLAIIGLISVCIADAQQVRQIPRVGFLIASTASAQEPRLAAFKRGLRELGYVEGQNIIIELRSGEGKSEASSRRSGADQTEGRCNRLWGTDIDPRC
jgi:hypothetical protein